MRFQQLGAFEKHLEQTSADHFSKVYLVITACSFERKMITQRIISSIRKKKHDLETAVLEQKSLSKIQEELHTRSLLNRSRALIWDEIDGLKSDAREALLSYVVKPSPFIYLILGAGSLKPLSELLKHGSKEIIICDLTQEKPWERKERIKKQLIQWAKREDKIFVENAADALVDKKNAQLPILYQELQKLLCYCAEKPSINMEAVNLLCLSEKTPSVWALAESIVWEEYPSFATDMTDLSSFLYLLIQVRLQLQLGLQLSMGFYPKHSFVKPKVLEKITRIARQKSPQFFHEALGVLFELENLAKNSSLSSGLLLDLLVAKIHRLKSFEGIKDAVSAS